MSVINQVLQDLEKRHAQGSPMPGAAAGGVRAVVRSDDHDGGRWRTALLGVGLGLAIGVGAYAWHAGTLVLPDVRPLAPTARAPDPASPVTPAAPAAVAAPAPVSAASPPIAAAPVLPEPAIAAPVPPVVAPVPPPVRMEAIAGADARAPASLPPSRRPEGVKVAAASAETPSVPAATTIDKRDLPPGPAARAEARFRQGALLLQQGRAREAETSFLAALVEDPGHVPSRQTLLGLYLEARRHDDAEALARDALRATPHQALFAMVLARLQAERGDAGAAVQSLQGSRDAGRTNGDYVAMLAALLQRQGRHGEAADEYQAAIGLGNARPTWFMGQGISLRELGRREDSRAAFQSALDSGGLSPELKGFVERQIAALRATAP